MAAQLILPISADESRSFDNFVDSPNHRLVEHLKSLLSRRIDGQEPSYFGVLIWGQASSGKTHLLTALSEYFSQLGGQAVWLDAGKMQLSDLNDANSNTLIFIDDIEALMVNAKAEQALLSLVEKLKQNNVLLLISARKPAAGLAGNLKDLSSRLKAMDNFELHDLPEKDKQEVLKKSAYQRGIILSDEVINWLLNHTSRDLAKLMNLLDQIDSNSLAQHRKVTIPLVKSILN